MKRFMGLIFCSAAFAFFPVPSVLAEAISCESALVWRADNSGDYKLPLIAADSAYVSEDTISANGVIESITATWVSDAEVALEVSADGGLHYVRVINGVPLKNDFVRGSSLKWRLKTGEDARVNEIRLVYTDSSGAVLGFGNPDLSGFKFKKGVRISGSSFGELFNYQVKIRVGESAASKNTDLDCDGHIAADFNDIRFTLPDQTTTLDYSLERVIGYKPNRVAEFFVKVPHIPVSGMTIYAYYGNPAAKVGSDPKATFDFYDQFGGSSFDAEKWTAQLSPAGNITVSNDTLSLDAASLVTRSFEFRGGVVEYSATAQNGFETRLVIGESNTDSAQTAYSSAYQGAEHCIAVGGIVRANVALPIAAGARYDYRLISMPVKGEPDSRNITFERYSPGFVEKQAEVIYKGARALKKGLIGLKAGGAGRGETLTKFHWIRVRKYVQPEPAVDRVAEFDEERAETPFFRNIALDPKGNMILAEGAKEGLYASVSFSVPYDVRIMVPEWKAEGASISISADKGKTYKRDCVNSAYYYASRKDFAKGRDIKYRMIFRRGDDAGPEVSSFKLQCLPGSIVALSPNGGETLKLGSSRDIKWTAWDYEPSYPMKIEYSLDSGATFATLINRTQNSGSYSWDIASDPGLVTQKGRIRISDGFDNSVSDESDRDFSILP